MELLFDYHSDYPSLVVRFESIDDLVEFLVGFWELI